MKGKMCAKHEKKKVLLTKQKLGLFALQQKIEFGVCKTFGNFVITRVSFL